MISPHDPNALYHAAQRPPAQPRRGADLGGDQPRPDAQRQDEAGPLGRPHHAGQHRASSTTARSSRSRSRRTSRDSSGRHGRRPRPRHARRRQDTGRTSRRRGMPEWIQVNSIDVVAARRGDRLRRRDAVQVRRLPPVPLQDERLRQDVDEDRRRHPGRRLHARRARGPRPARPALRGNRDRALRLVRRRRAAGSRSSSTCRSFRSPTSSSRTKDLVVATQGRSFWILDDLTPLHDYKPEIAPRAGPPVRAARRGPDGRRRRRRRGGLGAAPPGKNPPNGVVVSYWLKEKPGEKEPLTVEFLDGREGFTHLLLRKERADRYRSACRIPGRRTRTPTSPSSRRRV